MEMQREDLEKLYASTFKGLREGDVVTGKVIVRRDDGVIVDLGLKSEGFIPHEEMSDDEQNLLRNQLAITAYPAFLVNNKLKFSGVQSAEAIKGKFCEMNDLEECDVILSEDIK